MQEPIAEFIIGLLVFLAFVIFIVKVLENKGMLDDYKILIPGGIVVLLHFFEGTTFNSVAAEIYTFIFQKICIVIGKDIIDISEGMSVNLTAILVFVIYYMYLNKKSRTEGKDEILKQKNFAERSEMFCITLRQRLDEIDREASWNEDQFTSLEAEIEVVKRWKRKKKYGDLIKCLKRSYRHGTTYLVLGPPGSGKSVSLRKLCSGLLKGAKKLKKIPVYIDLKEWNEDWNINRMPGENDLTEFILKTLGMKADASTKSFLRKYFQIMHDDGRWYFIFDSFDEMPCLMGKKNCRELIDGISSLLYQFMTKRNKSGGVVASRLYKAPSSAMSAIATLRIQELRDTKIKTVLEKYTGNKKAAKLLFGEREDLVSLCRSPFYLALLLNYISENGIELPRNQMELYHSFIDCRLKKCADMLESEELNEDEVHQAAKKLAVFMQETEGCGLECPTELLFQQEDEAYWRKILLLLRHARICRVDDQYKTVSFVHKRFQEFFLAKDIIDKDQIIGYEDYCCDILNDTGRRDALMIYCEVTKEEKAREIAEFCWQTIQGNIKYTDNIYLEESQDLVSALYFMQDAFRNRKQVLSDFNEDLYQMVKGIFDKGESNKNEDTNQKNIHSDYVFLLAFANSIIFFSKAKLRDLVLLVYRMNNQMLNDIIMKNSRTLDELDYHIENEYAKYFAKMNIKDYLKQFFDIHFSLSVSDKFKYVKKMHVITLILNMRIIFMVVCYAGILFTELVHSLLSGGLPQISLLQIMAKFNGSNIQGNHMEKILQLAWVLFAIMVVYILFFYRLAKLFRMQIHLIALEMIFIVSSMFEGKKIYRIDIISIVISTVIILVSVVIIYIHDFKYYTGDLEKTKKERKDINDKYLRLFVAAGGYSTLIVIWGSTAEQSRPLFSGLMTILMVFIIIAFFIILIFYALFYLKRFIWFRKQPKQIKNIKHMEREELESNLKMLYFDDIKYKYLEMLLQQGMELKGSWPQGIRPQCGDDRADYALVKLDCAKLRLYDYLF